MKIVTNRKIVDLQNKSNDFADAEYESVVRGDFHSADGEYYDADGDDEYYDADGDYSNGIGDNIANKIAEKYGDSEGVAKTPATAEDKKMVLDQMAKEDTKSKKTGYFSKDRRDIRKAERGVRQKERRDDRIATRIERRKNRKAKYGARPLNPFTKGGKQFWKDNLPKLKKKANGNYEKTDANGQKSEIDKKDVTVIPPPANAPKDTPPAVVETKDLQTKAEVVTTVVNGETVVAKNYSENQTEKATDDTGKEQVYKKEDVVDEGSGEDKKPMSNIVKYSLIGGGVLVVGVIGYLIYKSMKNK